MLLNSLYTLDQFSVDSQHVRATIKLDPTHEIFKGHFPNQPVLPGVCLLEVLKDLVSKAMDKAYLLSSAGNIKYLKVVDPQQNQILNFEIKLTKEQDDSLKVVASSSLEDGSVNFKFKGIFTS